jgi:hypothetical protein
MIFKLTFNEIEQVIGTGAKNITSDSSNSTWIERHLWETIGISTIVVVGIAALNIYAWRSICRVDNDNSPYSSSYFRQIEVKIHH